MAEPVCDLVLLSWNHLEQTRPCLETLAGSTTVPCRLFLVDNGSEPPVREFLRGVRPAGAIQEVVLLQNETNEGFPRGMNRGIRASRAPYVCLLNNDLRLTTGWLEELVAVAEAHPTLGVLNPNTSNLDNTPKGITLEAYAQRLRAARGQHLELGMCIGFCMLIKRAVLDAIGGLSEEVERIFFEDEDFCMRAQQAGFQCGVALGAYVFHAEHQTVKELPEREALFARNRRWCHGKWGRWVRMAWPRFTPVVPGSSELRHWLEQLLGFVRRRTLVYVYGPMPDGFSRDGLCRSVGLVPHADLRWYAVPRALAPLAAAAMILKRRKKRFNVITAPTPGWGRWMRRFTPLHGAAVVPEDDDARLRAEWARAAWRGLAEPAAPPRDGKTRP